MLSRFQFVCCIFLALSSASASAQPSRLEQLLANPAVQALLSRQGDLDSTVVKCRDAAFRRSNAAVCQQADDAIRITSLPVELRVLLSKPQSAASIRELCIGVQGMPMQESYLCAELFRAEPVFRQQAEQARIQAAQDRIRP
jgi:hypothetical protein